MDLKKLIEKFKQLGMNKQLTNIVIVILVGILIIIAASAFKDTSSLSPTKAQNQTSTSTVAATTSELSTDDSTYENEQEAKLKSLLENIQGVGNVQVMIYYAKGEEEVPAYNESISSSIINENDSSGGKRTTTQNSNGSNVVLTTDGDNTKPLILDKYKPKVTGILITAEGADNSNIKLNITESVSELFGISVNNVNVCPMKK